MTWNAVRPVNLAFGLTAAVLLYLTYTSYTALQEANQVSNARSETIETIRNLNELLIDVQDAETGQRGFLLTGNEAYLKPYTEGSALARETMAQLKTSTAVSDSDRLADVDRVMGAKLAELKETIDLRRRPGGFEMALRIVNTDSGKKAMDRIRRDISELVEINLARLRQRDAELSSHGRRAFRLTLGASLAAIVITGIFLAKLRADLQAKREARLAAERTAAEMKEKNVELEQAIAQAKTLRGLLPLCSSCKKVRNDKGYWNQVEVFIRDNSEAQITHGICPDCAVEFMRSFSSNGSNNRILLLDDDELDAGLIESALKRSGMSFEFRHVATKEAFLQSLDFPDVILADWFLPGFGGEGALDLLRQRNMPVPFIIVSGYIGENAVVDALRKGAIDYVSKDKLSRLGEAINRAINEYRVRDERNRAEKEWRESEERLQRVTESVPVGIFYIGTDGRFRFVNDRLCQMTGLSRESALKETWLSMIHTEDRPRVTAEWKACAGRTDVFAATFREAKEHGNFKMLIQSVHKQGDPVNSTGSAGALLKLDAEKTV